MDHDVIGPTTVSLEGALTTLEKSATLFERLRVEFGDDSALKMGAMMRAGGFSGELGARLHDYLIDATCNDEAEVVWAGSHTKPHYGELEEWPIHVFPLCGIYWAWTPEFDPVGYFLTLDDARHFCLDWFDGVAEKK